MTVTMTATASDGDASGTSAVAAQPHVCAAAHARYRFIVPGTSPELLGQRRPEESTLLYVLSHTTSHTGHNHTKILKKRLWRI